MPIRLDPAGVIATSGQEVPLASASIARIDMESGAALVVTDHLSAVSWQVSGAGHIGVPQWHVPGDRVALGDGSVADPVLQTARQSPTGTQAALDQAGLASQMVTLVSAAVDGRSFYVAAASDGAGLTSYVIQDDGTPGAARTRSDNNSLYLRNVADLAVIETAQATYIAAASASENGIGTFRLAGSGSLNSADDLGQQDSLPVQTFAALEALEVDGTDYLIAAAAGSSSLTVFEVAANGDLTVTDHLSDALPTRFANAGQLASIQTGGQGFVVASGSDDGLSLFQLTAEGRLVHHHSVADTSAASLSNISALGMMATDTGLMILAASAAEPGLTRFTVALDPGLVQRQTSGTLTGSSDDDLLSLDGTSGGRIDGGAGRDLISDGPGEDTLRGGIGADTFLMQADGARDVITDIRPGEDLLDLSLWPFFYTVGQLEIDLGSTGTVLTFGDEVLELRAWNGAPLDEADVATLLAAGPGRSQVTVGPLQVADLPADPDPFPDTVPPPDPLPGTTPDPAPPPSDPANPGVDGGVYTGTDGPDALTGGAGDDRIWGRGGDDTLRGLAGNDEIAGSDGNDHAIGGGGNDNLGGGLGNDTLQGSDGQDTLGAGQGDDWIQGGAGDDVGSAGPGNDTIEGNDGDDTLAGSFGNDLVKGGGGDDSLGGGTGQDQLTGGTGNDFLGGGQGDDIVRGGEGNDFVAGGGRHDTVMGEQGNDTLNGGAGSDRLTGGIGADVFVFNVLIPGEVDVITDFENGVDQLRIMGVSGVNQAARFEALSLTADGNNSVMTYNGYRIVLEDVALGALGREDMLLT